MAEPTNIQRADRAAKMVRYYQDRIRTDLETDLGTIMADALADMMHLARFEKVDWKRVKRLSESYFNEELEGGGEGPRSWSPRGWKGIR